MSNKTKNCGVSIGEVVGAEVRGVDYTDAPVVALVGRSRSGKSNNLRFIVNIAAEDKSAKFYFINLKGSTELDDYAYHLSSFRVAKDPKSAAKIVNKVCEIQASRAAEIADKGDCGASVCLAPIYLIIEDMDLGYLQSESEGKEALDKLIALMKGCEFCGIRVVFVTQQFSSLPTELKASVGALLIHNSGEKESRWLSAKTDDLKTGEFIVAGDETRTKRVFALLETPAKTLFGNR